MFPIRARGVMPCLPCMAACLTEGQSTQGGEDRWRGRGVEGHWGLASTTERHTNEPCEVGAGEHDAKNSIGFSLAGYNQPFGQCSPARVPCVSVVKSPWPVLADGVEARETPGQISLLDSEAGADPATSIYHPPLLACIYIKYRFKWKYKGKGRDKGKDKVLSVPAGPSSSRCLLVQALKNCFFRNNS